MAYTTLEEISKSQFAADVFTGLHTKDEFKKFYSNHQQKIRRMGWAHEDAGSPPNNLKWIGPDQDDVLRIDPHTPVFQKRQHALYIDVDFSVGTILRPSEQITAQDATEIIHIVDVALQRIWETTEYWGHQIGTKGFMK